MIAFNFIASTFNVNVEPQINEQSRYRPSIDKSVTETMVAMINSLFHTTNLSLQEQFRKYKLIYKAMLLIFFLIIFTFIIIFIVFENNRSTSSNSNEYTEFNLENELYYETTYIALAALLVLSLFGFLTYNRLYRKLREQWRNECVRNLCQSAAIWSSQFPIIQFEIKYPGYMYQDLLKAAIKKSKKAFKDTSKKQKKKKKKNILKSPRMGSPLRAGFSNFNSPAKYDRLSEEKEESLNTCKLALCCCFINDNWGFIRIFYKFDANTNNDGIQYALNQLQKNFCLIDEDEPQKNNVQIVQMVQPNQLCLPQQPNANQLSPNQLNVPSHDNVIEISEEEMLEIDSGLVEGSEIQ